MPFTTSRTRDHAATRRSLLLGATAGIISMPFIRAAAAADRKIVARDPGGPIGALFQKVFYQPFEKETGITVVGVTSDSEPSGLIKAMVEAKSYTWDMAILATSHVEILSAINALEAVGSPGPNVAQIPEQFRGEFFVGTAVSSNTLGYRPDLVKLPPKGWADFFDVERVPGRRALRKHAFDTVEFALLADGVPRDQLYPLDLDRAFKRLSAVKKSNPVWWSAGAQITQVVSSGEADMVAGFTNRFGYAIDNGLPGVTVWDGGSWFCEGWGILKGTPNAGICREFVEFTSDAARQAAWAPQMRLGPTNAGALALTDAARVKSLPTHPENFAKMFKVDSSYWRKEQGPALERFNAWLVG